ncbi:MAG: NrfD/PsrC family molybdoenzyme membrane anchor subunit [Acidobacteriota bacterium]
MPEALLPEAIRHQPLMEGPVTVGSLDDQVLAWPDTKPGRGWFIAITITSLIMLMGFGCIGYLVYEGIGVLGNNVPVAWGFPIINFVFWVGIGHAGTLISAILFMFRKRWRNAISRAAEAMTIFALCCAGIFPLIHVGRPWFGYWLFPYPNVRDLWINFRSPLVWDVFAVSTYFSVSLLFWYLGLMPDLASMRERTTSRLRKGIYRILSLGWVGSARNWLHYEKAYLLLAGLATGLVLSVHSVVSFDFAVSLVPGWHMTIFPPYFVAGAIFAGFAMVVLVLSVVRKTMHMENLITMTHMDMMNKMILTMSCLMGYSYLMEGFTAWYSSDTYIRYTFYNYVFGDQWWAGWITITCNVLIPQLLWVPKFRRSFPVMLFVSACVTVGMWFERYTIIVLSLHRNFLPSSWGVFVPTLVDFGILLGSFGLFFTLVLLFARVLPVIATSEVKMDVPHAQPKHAAEVGHA